MFRHTVPCFVHFRGRHGFAFDGNNIPGTTKAQQQQRCQETPPSPLDRQLIYPGHALTDTKLTRFSVKRSALDP